MFPRRMDGHSRRATHGRSSKVPGPVHHPDAPFTALPAPSKPFAAQLRGTVFLHGPRDAPAETPRQDPHTRRPCHGLWEVRFARRVERETARNRAIAGSEDHLGSGEQSEKRREVRSVCFGRAVCVCECEVKPHQAPSSSFG